MSQAEAGVANSDVMLLNQAETSFCGMQKRRYGRNASTSIQLVPFRISQPFERPSLMAQPQMQSL